MILHNTIIIIYIGYNNDVFCNSFTNFPVVIFPYQFWPNWPRFCNVGLYFSVYTRLYNFIWFLTYLHKKGARISNKNVRGLTQRMLIMVQNDFIDYNVHG